MSTGNCLIILWFHSLVSADNDNLKFVNTDASLFNSAMFVVFDSKMPVLPLCTETGKGICCRQVPLTPKGAKKEKNSRKIPNFIL